MAWESRPGRGLGGRGRGREPRGGGAGGLRRRFLPRPPQPGGGAPARRLSELGGPGPALGRGKSCIRSLWRLRRVGAGEVRLREGSVGPCPGLLAGNPGEGSAPHRGVRSRRCPPPPPPGAARCPPVGSLRWWRGALGWPAGRWRGPGDREGGGVQAPSPAGPSRGDPETSARAPLARPPRGWRRARCRGPRSAQLPPGAPCAARAARGTEKAAVGELSFGIQSLPRSHLGLFRAKTGDQRLWSLSLIHFSHDTGTLPR